MNSHFELWRYQVQIPLYYYYFLIFSLCFKGMLYMVGPYNWKCKAKGSLCFCEECSLNL